MKTLNTFLGFFIFTTLLSGCSMKHVDAPLQNITTVPDKQQKSAETNPLTVDLNYPLIKEFGDIPEVRTYLRLQHKLEQGIGLTVNEAIEFYTAEVLLYPTPAAKETLKDLKADKKRYERLGIPADRTVLTEHNDRVIPPPEFVLVHPFKDDPNNPSPHNPFIKKFGDIPEVRTYLRLKHKLERGVGLNIDEAVELYTAEAYLYPTPATKANLKAWIKDKKRYERLGIPVGEPVLGGKRKTDSSDEYPADTETAD